jgi:glycosyltransferase involved in cell wall biosynthesis
MIPAVSGRVRTLLRARSKARDLRSRRPPRLTVRPSDGRPPVVYYLTPDQRSPRGGVRMMYRHVDLLNQAGIEAAVLHSRTGFRCEWFGNSTRVTSAGATTLTTDDILVVPEYYAPGYGVLPVGPRKIIFNQGAYHTFDYSPFGAGIPGAPYTDVDNVIMMLTVSEDSAALLRYAFPDIPVHRARAVVDRKVFHPTPDAAPRPRRIAFIPRRRPQERQQLLQMLAARSVLDGWELVPIEGRTEQQTADLMRGSAIFLSFSERDGFGLPPAEAMACGCFVVGFTGGGGRDYFDPEYSTPVIGDGDMLAFARAVEEAIRRYDSNPDDLAKAGLLASDRILGRYQEDGLRSDLVSLYGPNGVVTDVS